MELFLMTVTTGIMVGGIYALIALGWVLSHGDCLGGLLGGVDQWDDQACRAGIEDLLGHCVITAWHADEKIAL